MAAELSPPWGVVRTDGVLTVLTVQCSRIIQATRAFLSKIVSQAPPSCLFMGLSVFSAPKKQ